MNCSQMSLVESGLKVVLASVPYFLWSKDSQSVNCKISFWCIVLREPDCLYILPLSVSCVDWSNLIVMSTVFREQAGIDIRLGADYVLYCSCSPVRDTPPPPPPPPPLPAHLRLWQLHSLLNIPHGPAGWSQCPASYLDNKTSDWRQI